MQRFLIVCLGGAAGSGTRYLVALWAGQKLGSSFPYGTLFVNLIGCFVIAMVMQLSLDMASFPPGLRLGLTTGFCGGLTTYSTFNYETTNLFNDGATPTALLNVGVTAIGCFAMGLVGLFVARRLVGA